MQFEITVDQLQQLVPKAYKVHAVDPQDGVLGISLYDTQKDQVIELNVYEDGVIISATPAMTYDDSVMSVEELETAIHAFYKFVRFDQPTLWRRVV